MSFCRAKLKKDLILKLDDFLTTEALLNLRKEAKMLHKKAFYCSQKHTILLDKKNNMMSRNDPCNLEIISDKGCVPHDLIPNSSHLNSLYKSKIFINFLINVLKIKKIFSYKDKLSSINYNYYEKNQQLGWHYDNASFAITLLIENSNKGGIFEYVNKGRNYEKKYLNKKYISSIISEKKPAKKLVVKPGSLILFYGRNYLHRVTPVLSNKGRVLVTLNYNTEKGIELSTNARRTFFGRIN